MDSSYSTDYQKLSAAAPPPYGEPADGIPVFASVKETPIQGQPWSSGLFDCLDDVPNCCVTWWCPCVTFGQIAEIVDKGSSSCGTSGALYTLISGIFGVPWMYSCFYRSKMRRQHMLHNSPCGDCMVGDCLVHFFCEPCALCQEYRELKNCGFDMSLGWHENVEKQKYGMVTAPVVENGMSK